MVFFLNINIYRAVTQKSLDWFKSRKPALFTDHDVKFGLDVKGDYSYTGEEHYRGLFNLVNHLQQATDGERVNLLVRTVVLIRYKMVIKTISF